MTRAIFAILGLILLQPMVAWAISSWAINPAESQITFRYTLNGEEREGTFHKFQATGQFSATRPEAASLDLSVATESIDLKNTLASAYATSAEWFDSKNHPNVVFSLTKLTHLEDTAYLAEGVLSMRGAKKPITAKLNLDVAENTAFARGSLTIARRDFWLGYGPSAAVVTVSEDVVIDFNLRARIR
ncbi:MAG: YceI family protein [Pseudomonadota bacterium]